MKRICCGVNANSGWVLHFAQAIVLSGACSICADAELFGIDRTNGDLYRISTSNADLSLVGNTGVPNLGSLEYRPGDGFLYGFTLGSSSTLYRIDPATANATAVGPLGIGLVFEGALQLAPNGIAYGANQGSSSSPVLFTVNLDTGVATTIGTISGGVHDINGLAWRSDGMLVGVDSTTNSLLAINPANAQSSTIAALSPTVGTRGGMAAVGDSGYFSTAAITGSDELYSVNLFTGAHALVGSLGFTSGAGIGGLAIIPEPSAFVLAAIGVVLLGARRPRVMQKAIRWIAGKCIQ
jgi:hypothetical protein